MSTPRAAYPIARIWLVATGMVALSFECVGAAVVFFGIAGQLLNFA
jgi:hypothetical protein